MLTATNTFHIGELRETIGTHQFLLYHTIYQDLIWESLKRNLLDC